MKTALPYLTRRCCLLLACGLAAAPSLLARQIWVATYGNDQSADGSINAPYRSVQQAVNNMSGGDEIWVRDGTYTDNDVFVDNKGGTAGRRTVLRAENRWGAKLRLSNSTHGIKVQFSPYVTIWGFDLSHVDPTNASVNQGAGIQYYKSDHARIQHNYVHDYGCNGISFRESDYADIEDNVTQGNAKNSNFNCSGISVYQPNQRVGGTDYRIYIRRNVSFENEVTLAFNVGAGDFDVPIDGNGIILDDFANTQALFFGEPNTQARYEAWVLIENNLVFDNGGSGIKSFLVKNALIRNNTLYHNLRITRLNGEPSRRSAEISLEEAWGDHLVYNNIVTALNETGCESLQYQQYDGFGPELPEGLVYLRHNTLTGPVDYSDPTKILPLNNQMVTRDRQGYAGFANPTVDPGPFGSTGDFRQYFQLVNQSPAAGSGIVAGAAFDDLGGRRRVQGNDNTVERGAFEGTVGGAYDGGSVGTPVNEPATPAAGGDAYVYRDNYEDSWQDWSYFGEVTVQDPGIKFSGEYAIKFLCTDPNGWGALAFRRNDARPGAGLQRITFRYRSWDGQEYTGRFRVYTSDDGESGLVWKNFEADDDWREASFSAGELGSPSAVKRMDFNIPAYQTLWVDDLRLVYATSNLATVEVDVETADSDGEAVLKVMPTVNTGVFDVALDVPAGLEEVHVALLGPDGRQVDAATLPVSGGRNRMHFDVTAQGLAAGTYLIAFRSADGTFRRAERLIIR